MLISALLVLVDDGIVTRRQKRIPSVLYVVSESCLICYWELNRNDIMNNFFEEYPASHASVTFVQTSRTLKVTARTE